MALLARLLRWLRRRWALLLASALLVALLALRSGELAALLRVIANSLWQWVLLAAVGQTAYYWVYALLYEQGFAAVGVRSSVRQILPPLFASLFAKIIVPSGAAAVPLFAAEISGPGQSVTLVAEGVLLVVAIDLLTALPMLALALLYLSYRGVLEAYQVVITALFALVSLAFSGLIYLGRRWPSLLRGLFRSLQRLVNRLATWVRRRPPLPLRWAEDNANQYIEAAQGLSSGHRRSVLAAFELALLAHIVEIASLYPVTRAVGWPLGVGPLTAALAMDTAFSVVNLVPHGLGIAEGAIALVLVTLGVSAERALAIAIIFRGLNVWLPVLIGFVLLRQMRSVGGDGR